MQSFQERKKASRTLFCCFHRRGSMSKGKGVGRTSRVSGIDSDPCSAFCLIHAVSIIARRCRGWFGTVPTAREVCRESLQSRREVGVLNIPQRIPRLILSKLADRCNQLPESQLRA